MEKTMNKMCCALLVKVQGAGKNRTVRVMGTDEPSFTTNSETGADHIIGILDGRGGADWIESREGNDITRGRTPCADKFIGATASFTQRASDDSPATVKLIADVEFAVNFALTKSNPNHAQDLPPNLDADVFALPWLRGFGNVKSLPIAYQENPALKQAASDLIAQGRDAILGNFEHFIAQWSGLDAAHGAHGVTRTNITILASGGGGRMQGGLGDDQIYGIGGNDVFEGNEGKDTLNGDGIIGRGTQAGASTMNGSITVLGNDRLRIDDKPRCKSSTRKRRSCFKKNSGLRNGYGSYSLIFHKIKTISQGCMPSLASSLPSETRTEALQ